MLIHMLLEHCSIRRSKSTFLAVHHVWNAQDTIQSRMSNVHWRWHSLIADRFHVEQWGPGAGLTNSKLRLYNGVNIHLRLTSSVHSSEREHPCTRAVFPLWKAYNKNALTILLDEPLVHSADIQTRPLKPLPLVLSSSGIFYACSGLFFTNYGLQAYHNTHSNYLNWLYTVICSYIIIMLSRGVFLWAQDKGPIGPQQGVRKHDGQYFNC